MEESTKTTEVRQNRTKRDKRLHDDCYLLTPFICYSKKRVLSVSLAHSIEYSRGFPPPFIWILVTFKILA